MDVNPTADLKAWLFEALEQRQIPTLPEGVGLFYGFQAQDLRAVPIQTPTLVWILAGRKTYLIEENWHDADSGELMLLPADTRVHVRNHPDAQGRYLALCLPLTDDDQDWLWSRTEPQKQKTVCQIIPSIGFACSFQQWITLAARFPLPADIQCNRRRELLDWLMTAGEAGNLLTRAPESQRRVLQLIHTDMAHPWRLSDVAERLHMSESTLHRQLTREGTGFRQLLEQSRLAAALGLLQGTRRSILEIAASVGYQSPSRFAERFRQHFGLSPSELRDTHETDDFRRKPDPLRRVGIQN